MNNVCLFINWCIKDAPKIDTINNGMMRATISAHSPKPNKAGIWNKNYFTAFGDVAERIDKCNIQPPCYVTITAEQDVYKDKEGKIRNSYVIKDFSLMPRYSRSDTVSEDTPVQSTPAPTPTSAPSQEQKPVEQSNFVPGNNNPAPATPPQVGGSHSTGNSGNVIFGLDALTAEFM